MKKFLVMAIVLILAISMVACGGNTEAENGKTDGNGHHLGNLDVSDANYVLNNVWSNYEANEKFSAVGGDLSEENMTMDAPGVFSLEDPEIVDNTLGFPAEEIEKIDDAASIMHMMNANTFTAGVYHVVNSSDIQALAEAVKTNLEERQWICGAPEEFVIAEFDGYLISCFGSEELVDDFIDNFEDTYVTTKVLYEIPLM